VIWYIHIHRCAYVPPYVHTYTRNLRVSYGCYGAFTVSLLPCMLCRRYSCVDWLSGHHGTIDPQGEPISICPAVVMVHLSCIDSFQDPPPWAQMPMSGFTRWRYRPGKSLRFSSAKTGATASQNRRWKCPFGARWCCVSHIHRTNTTTLGSKEVNVVKLMFAQYNDQNSQNMSVNRALRSFDLTQKEIEDAQLPVKWYSNGGVRCPLYKASDLSQLERSLRHGANAHRRVRGEENPVPPLDPSQTPAGSHNLADICPFVVSIKTTGEDAPVPPKRSAQDTARRAQDVIGLQTLLMSFAACGNNAHTSSHVVDAATAKSMWFLNEADLLMVEGTIQPIKTTEYSLYSIIQRSLWKYGHGSLLKMIEARHDWETFLKVDQVALLKCFCLKKTLDQYPAPLKTQVYLELITSLEEMVTENTVECSRAEKEREKKRLELHFELISCQPCALRTQTRYMRFVWSNNKVRKLQEARKAMKKQIQSLLGICTEIISFLPDTHDRQPSTRRVLVDLTNQKKALLRPAERGK